ncbi:MAG: hypothetical protein ABIG39_02755 [Candidatus Micrarchaeota archaeon]
MIGGCMDYSETNKLLEEHGIPRINGTIIDSRMMQLENSRSQA